MIYSPELAKTAAILANTPDDILPLFPVMERAVIIAVKQMMKNGKETGSATTRQHTEHQTARGTQDGIQLAKT